MLKAGLTLLFITGLTTAGCSSPERNIRRIAYCLSAEFNQDGKENRSEICNMVEVGETPDAAKALHVTMDRCRANASGLAIPVQQGNIVMLIDRQAGEPPGQAACFFGRRFEAKKPELGEDSMPRFVFVPTGGSVKDAIEVGYQRLGEYGIDNLKISIEENINKPFTYDPLFLERFGCSYSSLDGQYTSSPPTCNSLATYQVVVPYPPFE